MFNKVKNFKSIYVMGALVIFVVSGCADNHNGNSKQNVGTVVGAGLGALAGAQFGKGDGRIATAVVGSMLGGYIGNQTGASLDKADAVYYSRTFTNSLEYNPSGVTSTWRNPDSGHYGKITPRETYVERGQNCREYIQEVFIGGKREHAFGKACRRSDGSWEILQ